MKFLRFLLTALNSSPATSSVSIDRELCIACGTHRCRLKIYASILLLSLSIASSTIPQL